MNEDEFINTFNSYYPFERYIFKNKHQINYLFDDLVVTEFFVPTTEIKPVTDDNGRLITFTRIPDDEIYVKVQCKGVEFRLAFYDFDRSVREEIRYAFIKDLGGYEFECLYVDHEDMDDLKEALQWQKTIIESKYKVCNIKASCICTDTIELVKQLK